MAIEIITLRLFIAAILGGVVGIERENQKRAAGLRTHILVSLGSALVMVTSEYMFKLYGGDPGRLGAQVISGIGFLGAGTIIKQGGSVRGLTTAASLWVVACIGLAAGIGFYTAAIITAAIVFLTLALLRKFENVLVRKSKSSSEIIIRIDNKPGKLGEVASYIGKSGVNIANVDIEADDEDKLIVNFTLNLPKGLKKEDVLFKLKALPDVKVIE
ncbi:MAG: MgtC/SapB family protein [Ruminiclostridium sp.]|nr:MgtC/SapB family protein [Ruminiclostridium sp.]